MRSSFIIKTSGAGLAVAMLIAACTKDVKVDRQQGIDLSNKSMIQVFNATVGSGGSLITVDGSPVNGTTALAFGSSFPATTYFAADPGLRSFVIKASTSPSTQVPLNFQTGFQASTYYNIFTYDTLTSPKFITVPTVLTVPQDTTARLRFANFLYAKTNTPNIDIYSAKRKAVIFSNIAANTVTDFVAHVSATSDTLTVREAGTSTSLGTLNAVNLGKKRSYTLVLRGRYGLATGTGSRALVVLTNY